ncbi:hypothetical protein KIW84_035790 [Lathyrus oleraceus]|uniref:P-type H(+)-exporting transporter n=1 Tax=Pisum sativum TaxID=3888 RepID=A0A9D5B181_PEA|nr:hypothetical protein KIW84_035790 [Pisum sativum]
MTKNPVALSAGNAGKEDKLRLSRDNKGPSLLVENQDAMDAAIVGTLTDPKEARAGVREVHFLPFNPVDKKTALTYIDSNGNWHRASKGVPEQIMNLRNLREDAKRNIHAIIDKFAERGLRSLAVSRQEVPEKTKENAGGPWQFVGLLSLFDPPRHDSDETIRRALHLGVNVKMITGEQLSIAKETGRRLGMITSMYSSATLLGQDKDASIAALPVEELIEKTNGFAGVFPEHKYEGRYWNRCCRCYGCRKRAIFQMMKNYTIYAALSPVKSSDISSSGLQFKLMASDTNAMVDCKMPESIYTKEDKEGHLAVHSEKLAIVSALLNAQESQIRITKNLRVFPDTFVALNCFPSPSTVVSPTMNNGSFVQWKWNEDKASSMNASLHSTLEHGAKSSTRSVPIGENTQGRSDMGSPRQSSSVEIDDLKIAANSLQPHQYQQ